MAEEFTRVYDGKNFKVRARPNSCFFCKHLTDIVWDYTNGPYMFFCDKNHMTSEDDEDPIEIGMRGLCKDFVDVEEKNQNGIV